MKHCGIVDWENPVNFTVGCVQNGRTAAILVFHYNILHSNHYRKHLPDGTSVLYMAHVHCMRYLGATWRTSVKITNCILVYLLSLVEVSALLNVFCVV